MKQPTFPESLYLHILRNPFGWSDEHQRAARLWAAGVIERLIWTCGDMSEDGLACPHCGESIQGVMKQEAAL
jgi:hypothetical protein